MNFRILRKKSEFCKGRKKRHAHFFPSGPNPHPYPTGPPCWNQIYILQSQSKANPLLIYATCDKRATADNVRTRFYSFFKKIFYQGSMDGLGLVARPLFSIYRWSCCSARVWHHCSTLKTSCSDAAILHTPLGLSRQTMSISGWIGGLVPQFLTCSPLPLSLPRISLGNLSIRTVTPLWAGTSPATLCCIYVLSPAQEGL